MAEHLRHDKECENCGYPEVTMAYCPKCGQKNVETRQSFVHLITHFAEDFTHYDGAFWKTIKYLLFRPAKLTKEYLEGKRQAYVPPVKLYIFISFVTFLIMALSTDTIAEAETETANEPDIKIAGMNFNFVGINREGIDTLNIDRPVMTIKSLDSLRALPKADEEHISQVEYWLGKAAVKTAEGNISGEKIREIAIHTFPKVLFIYMPIFAFWLWLFHGKKRWYFFDHGIFTLHYFSLLLLVWVINHLIIWPFAYFLSHRAFNWLMVLCATILLGYCFFYFFRAHRLMYGETRAVSRLKGLALFIINVICIIVVLSATMIYIVLQIH